MKRIIFCAGVVVISVLDGLCQNEGRGQGEVDTNYILIMKSYWFEDGSSTDPMLVRQMIRRPEGTMSDFRNAVKQISSDSIYAMRCGDAGDSDLIKQFLLSLEFYNLWFSMKKRRGSVEQVTIDMFFKGVYACASAYTMQWTEDGVDYGDVHLKHLADLSAYDFGRELDEQCDDERCVITFTPYPSTLECSKKFYDEVLFPRYLNYISKNHRVTPYQIEMQKIPWDD